jgi:hypothetical protein
MELGEEGKGKQNDSTSTISKYIYEGRGYNNIY